MLENEKQEVITQLLEIEKTYNVKVLYCSQVGSKLFGTDHAESDNDFRFLFLPRKTDLLLQINLNHIKIGKDTKEKNTKDDIDFDGWSLQKWFNLLKKGETNALNLLFSMFQDETIVWQDLGFTSDVRRNYKLFLNKNMKSFMGYALSQTKKFGIKGARYGELDEFVKYIETFPVRPVSGMKLDTMFESFKEYIKVTKPTYIKFVMAPGPRGTGEYTDIEYISILGKLFEGRITVEDFMERIQTQYKQFGNRTKAVADTVSKTDFKALSHSYLIAFEVLELVNTQFIKYPLAEADFILEIKKGNVSVEDTITKIEYMLNDVDLELLRSELPQESDEVFMNSFILDMYNKG